MPPRSRGQRLGNRWWPLILLAIIALLACATAASFTGALRSYVPVTLTSDRSGLVLETGAKVKLRGVNVGRVAEIHGDAGQARLELEIDPDQIRFIPANVAAKIDVTTVFGAKFVDLVYPTQPSPQRLSAGAVLRSANVTTEVNTVFENLVDVLDMVDPLKLNAVLTAVAEHRLRQVDGRTYAVVDSVLSLDAERGAFYLGADCLGAPRAPKPPDGEVGARPAYAWAS